MANPSKKVRFIQPRNNLKEKVGHGGIDPTLVTKAQNVIEESDLDFKPLAQNLMSAFGEAISTLKEIDQADQDALRAGLEKVTVSIMQLKANGGMFKYPLITEIANICLRFLEDLKDFHEDAYDILEAHKSTLQVIIMKDLKGQNDQQSKVLGQELKKACQRYHAKHQQG